ncbi:MAG: Tat pathway signal sequence domain protein [Selenomonas sp.]|nr:Tat pathway signal sequence domain protein [Selenomonas sp.]
MNKMKKKMVAGIVAGAVLLGTGYGALAQTAEANSSKDTQSHHMMKQGQKGQPPQMNADEAAKHIHETFGVDESQVKEAINAKKDFHDIGQAAMLSKLSGKSFKDVLAMKTDSNNWQDIGKSLGVTREQVHEQMNEMTAEHIAQKGNIDQAAALALLKNGYHSQDINAASILAKQSGKDIQSVLDMKKINNNWNDVAEQLGVDKSVLRPNKDAKGGPQGGPDGDMMGGPHGDAPQPPTDEAK